MLSQAEDRLDRTERDSPRKVRESAIRPPRDSTARGDMPGAAAGPDDEPTPADVQSVYHLIRSIAHRLDRLEQRLACQEAADRSRTGRRVRFLWTVAISLGAILTAAVAWKIAAPAGPDPFLIPGGHSQVVPVTRS